MIKHLCLFVCDSTVKPGSKENVKVEAQAGHGIILTQGGIFYSFDILIRLPAERYI